MTRQYVFFSRVNLRGILLIALATVQLASSAVDAQGSSTRWPTTEFKVFHSAPFIPSYETPADRLIDWFRETLRDMVLGEKHAAMIDEQDLAWGRRVEAHLHDIAVRYQAAGFEPPDLKVVEEGGSKKYVVYLIFAEQNALRSLLDSNSSGVAPGVPYPVHLLGDVLSRIHPDPPLWKDAIIIHRDKHTFDGSLESEVELYDTLAHELFHAFQWSYDRKYRSIAMENRFATGREVAVEGTAQGASTYLVTKRFPGYLETKGSSKFYLGGYGYFGMFLGAKKQFAYHTGSFWRHLLERFGALSVIEQMMRQPLSGSTMSDRVRWLDEALKKNDRVNEGLYTVFPHFASELVSYGGERYQKVSQETWQEWTVSGCYPIEISPGNETKAVYTFGPFVPLEAQCFELIWSGFEPDVKLEIEVIGRAEQLLDQLQIGIAWFDEGSCWEIVKAMDPDTRRKQTCFFEKLKVQTGPSAEKWAKTWELASGSYGAKGRGKFVITNVGLRPWESWSGDKLKPSANAEGSVIRFGFSRTESKDKKLAPPEAEHLRMPPPPQMREMLYGIKDKKPMPGTQLPEIRIPTIEITGNEPELLESFLNLKGNRNRRNSLREYRVMPDFTKPLQYGYTGPFYGLATIHDPAASGMSMISSQFCNPERAGDPIGKVLYVGEEQIKVHVKTDLCEMKISITPPYAQAITKIDHLDAVIVLPFGWRYFRDKAPVDIVTPGVDIFISRYHTRMQELWGPQWPATGGPTAPGAGSGPGPGTGGGPGEGGSGKGATVRPGCDCSCQGFEKMKTLSKRRDAESQKKLKEMSMCAMQCVSQWTACAQSGTSP